MPKKSKGKKKGGKKKSGKKKAAPKDEGPAFTEKEINLASKVHDISSLTHEYAKEIDTLQDDARKRDEDTLDMVHYLEQEVKRKENANTKLDRHLNDLEDQQLNDRKDMKEHFKATLERAERVFLQKEAQLLESNSSLRKQVEALADYKKMRAKLAKDLEATKRTITENERRHRQQLDDLERKFLAARDRLEREAAERIAVSRKVYKEEVGKELDEDSKRVRAENRKMERELSKQEGITDSLQAANLKLQQSIKKLRIDLDLTKQKYQEYGKRHDKQGDTIQILYQNVKKYEGTVAKLLRGVETEREARDKKNRLILERLRHELATLEEEEGDMGHELRTLRVHAKTVLVQRQEVERYFLGAIRNASNQQRNARKNKLKGAKFLHNRQMRALALREGEEGRLPPIPAGVQLEESEWEVDGVDLRYDPVYRLTGMLRLQLLRLLYSKINNSQSAQQTVRRPHSFAIDIDSQGQIIPVARPPRRRKAQQQRPNYNTQPQMIEEDKNTSFFITEEDHLNGQVM